MGFILAWKAFIKAFKEPEKAKVFLSDQPTPNVKKNDYEDPSHLRMLGFLQQEGRLIDFLKEDISAFSDAQVGAAVRRIHQECARTLEEFVTVRSLREEGEGSLIQVPKDYNPIEIKIVGDIQGEPPFTGVLMHKGWKAHKRSLPKRALDQTYDVICPAEIEVKR